MLAQVKNSASFGAIHSLKLNHIQIETLGQIGTVIEVATFIWDFRVSMWLPEYLIAYVHVCA